MTRGGVSLRAAVPGDASFLTDLWTESLRRVDRAQQHADVELLLARLEGGPDERIVVATYDGEVAGAIYLRIAPVSVLNPDLAVQALAPHVLSGYRRRGVGRHLMEAAVSLAEERGIGHVATAASSGSREGNRFMARLALGPQAVLRVAATHAVRAKLTAQTPVRERAGGGRQLTRVLAARRSQRRARAVPSAEPVGGHQGAGQP